MLHGKGQFVFVFFFNDTAPTEIYTLSLHDALPISVRWPLTRTAGNPSHHRTNLQDFDEPDRKSTRLNSSHLGISYAVFCLKKKNNQLLDERVHRARGVAREPPYVPVRREPLHRGVRESPPLSSRGVEAPGVFFFFKDTAPPEISPLSLPGPLPI